MPAYRPKLWTGLSAAVLIAAGGLAACGDGGQETAATQPAAGAEGATAPTAAPVGEGGEGGAEGGGGEAGAQGAYAAVPDASRLALRVAHLKGFVLAGQAAAPAEGPEAAAALVGQGLVEVFDPAADRYRELGVDEAALRRAAQTGAPADLKAALATLDAAAAKAGGDPREVVKGMTGIATGLYAEVNRDGAVDTVEYQHSMGAALAAQSVARNAGLNAPELDAFVKLWPTPQAPEDAAALKPASQVLAQASRVELALTR